MREQVLQWFERAVEVADGSRTVFLAENCGDEAVRSEVLSLLAYDVGEPDSVPQTIRDAITSLIREDEPRMPVQRVGAFELRKLLGAGGMGLVYEAHRVDGEVKQRAAVKFAQVSPSASERSRESMYRRFARERQMLAALRHPYIAGLIDAGTTPDGTPYAVIEQVDGVPIDDYCGARLLDCEERIRLVLKVCDAVQFAHNSLIVHSDIKPDNVLITADGIPKLIDFGAAADLGEDAPLSTVRAFTPGYASPEQCRGMAPTVTTDVYGLGALLYRLLTGTNPHERIGDESVVRPSVLRPELKGDIENILLKALQTDPSRRYGSARELADDLNRFLARRPVAATPDSVTYRLRRFIRRQWMPLLAIAALTAALLFAGGVLLRERRQALAQAAESRRLAERLLFDIHDEIGGVVGATRARERLGQMAVQYLEAIRRDRDKDPELAWELLNAYARLGQSRAGAASSIGDTKSGLLFAAKALTLGAVVEKSGPDAGRLDELFQVYEGLVPIFLEAERAAEQRETIDRLMRLAPRLAPLREAEALKHLARYEDAYGSKQRAYEAWARALGILRNLARESGRAETEAELATSLAGYGRSQAFAGEFEGAAVSLREAIRLAKQRVAAEPQLVRSQRLLYWSHIALGDVLGSPQRFSLGRPLEAAEEYRKARGIAETLVKADPANDIAKLDLSRAYSREGVALAALRPEGALEVMERARSLAMQASSKNHAALDARFAYLTSSIDPLVRLGKFETAEAHLSEAGRLAKEMERQGVAVDEMALPKAEALWLHATGRGREALEQEQWLLGKLPTRTGATLSENFATVDVLERMKVYAKGVDAAACSEASEHLVRTWSELQSMNPRSAFVRERAVTARRQRCGE